MKPSTLRGAFLFCFFEVVLKSELANDYPQGFNQMKKINIFQRKQEQDRLDQFVTHSAFDDDLKYMYHEADNAISSLLLFKPVSGMKGDTLNAIENMLGISMPAGTMLSFTNFGSPYINTEIDRYLGMRRQVEERNETIRAAKRFVEKRAAFMMQGNRKNLIPTNDVRLSSSIGYLTLKVPLKTKNPMSSFSADTAVEYQKEVRNFIDLRDKIISMSKVFGLHLQPATAEETKAAIKRYFNPFGQWENQLDETLPINQQLLPPGASMSWDKIRDEDIHFSGFSETGENNYAGILTIDRYPQGKDGFGFWRMSEMLGDLSGNGIQIGLPYALTTTIHYPDQGTKIAALRTAQGVTDKQSNPQMLKWSPRLREKNRAYQIMNQAIMENNRVVEVNTSMILFSRSRRELMSVCNRLESYYKNMGMVMRRERFCPAVTFFNNLPGNASPESIKRTFRFKTMGSSHAAHLLPIFDDWQGYGNALLLNTRRGRLFDYDLFHSNNKNFSFATVAEAGSGKSFFLNRMIQDYLSLDTKIYLFDRGGSYMASGQLNNAQILDFHLDSNVCLNPFTHVENIDEELPIITQIIAKMLNPDGDVSADQRAYLMEAIKSSFENKGQRAEVNDVILYLRNQPQEEAQRIGRLLGQFGSSGSMGRWFNGANTFKTDAQWTILETQGLSANPHLMKVVMMALSLSVSQEMYHSKNKNQNKMLIVEEAGDLMSDRGFALFLTQLYSKVRKEKGSVGVVVQNLGQLYQAMINDKQSFGDFIMASAGTMFVLEQKPEMIEKAFENKQIEVSDYVKHLIRSVHTVKGQYSEICVYNNSGAGIARLIESDFNKVMFSTEGALFETLKERVRKGEPVEQVIQDEVDRQAMTA